MIALVSAEFMKIRTTRAWWLFLLGFALFTAAALASNAFSHHYQLYPQQDLPDRAQALAQAAQARTQAGAAAIAASMMTSGQFLSFLISLMLGIQIATSEYAQRIATATFVTVPRRARVIRAKLIVAACWGALFWVIAVVVDGLVTPVFLQSQHLSTSLAGWTVVRSVLLSLLAFVMWALFGLGLGALIRGQVTAVVVAIASYAGGYAVVELVFHALYDLTHQGWILAAPVIAPAVASSVMITPGQSFPHAPPQWAGAVVMAAYVLVLAAAGIAQTLRRDVPAGTVLRLLCHLHRNFVVRDALIPVAERRPRGVFDHRVLVVVPGEPANRIQVREPGNGGECNFPGFVPAQQLGAAEPADRR